MYLASVYLLQEAREIVIVKHIYHPVLIDLLWAELTSARFILFLLP